MKKIAFYILERPPPEPRDESEFKDDSDCEGLAPLEVSAKTVLFLEFFKLVHCWFDIFIHNIYECPMGYESLSG